ncbi:MAG TPA: DUF3307 domain-containing protein [Candidatus Acidoferrum sp.]|nr:DUF3307 domain-containing protein [Candidatus Acidoferrum sp.]
MFLRTLLAVYLGHLAADFVFQTRRLVHEKRRGQASAYLWHGLTHYLSTVLLVGFFIPGSIVALRTHLVIGALALVHLLIDFAKVQLAAKNVTRDGAILYVVDQLVHLLSVALAAWLLSPGVPFSALADPLQASRNVETKFLAVLVIYLGVVFGGGYLIRFLMSSLTQSVKEEGLERAGEPLQNAGLYIGWLERFLILTALLLRSPAAVGLILTAKAITRYPEFKSARFAEYVLIGTLLSVSLAFVGAIFLAWLILGKVGFS